MVYLSNMTGWCFQLSPLLWLCCNGDDWLAAVKVGSPEEAFSNDTLYSILVKAGDQVIYLYLLHPIHRFMRVCENILLLNLR